MTTIEVVLAPAARVAADPALAAQLDALGKRSAEAQGLSRAITSAALFASLQQTQTLFIARGARTNEAIGYLKTGVKHLFYVTRKGVYSELDPLCVLDFFVSDAHQRTGIGLELFRTMLHTHDAQPAQLAYDRPSPKLLAFLQKHCGLVEFFPQPNNFVIFDDCFTTAAASMDRL